MHDIISINNSTNKAERILKNVMIDGIEYVNPRIISPRNWTTSNRAFFEITTGNDRQELYIPNPEIDRIITTKGEYRTV